MPVDIEFIQLQIVVIIHIEERTVPFKEITTELENSLSTLCAKEHIDLKNGP